MENRDNEIVARYGPSVYRLAFAQLRSRTDAEDIYQEVFLRYVDKHPQFESPDHAKAWFLRVTINCCKDLWRSPWQRLRVPLEEDLPFETSEEWGLHQQLKKLPKKYRAVLHLFYWEDLTTGQIAQVLGCKPATVRQRMTRARAMMKDLLTEEETQNV